MRRTRKIRHRKVQNRRNQRGGGALPYDWVNSAIQHPFYQNSESYKTDQIPNVPLTSESIGEVTLEEVAKHLKVLLGPITTAEKFYKSIEEQRGIRIGQDQGSVFETITIPWMNTVEMALRDSIAGRMNTGDVLSKDNVSITNIKSYPLLMWSLIASAPPTSDLVPMLGS